MPRRRALLLIGRGTVVAGAGLGLLVAACSEAPALSIPVRVALDVDPASLRPGEPVEVTFTVPGETVAIATAAWVLVGEDGAVTVFDPRCTHAQCRYRWASGARRFECVCHDGTFDLEGRVLSGPPPRALDRLESRDAEGILEVEIPAGFSAPRGD